MSALANMKLLESVRGRLEDFLQAECLVGDICTRKHKTGKKKKNKKKGAKTQKQSTNLISFELVQNVSIKT